MFVKVGGKFRPATQWVNKGGVWKRSSTVWSRIKAGIYIFWRQNTYTRKKQADIYRGIKKFGNLTYYGLGDGFGRWDTGSVYGKLFNLNISLNHLGNYYSCILSTADGQPFTASDGKVLDSRTTCLVLQVMQGNTLLDYEEIHIPMKYTGNGIYQQSGYYTFTEEKDVTAFLKRRSSASVLWSLSIIPAHDATA